MVEHKIKKEIYSTKGAIMNGAWTKNQTHCIGVFATYVREKQITISKRRKRIPELVIAPLSVSPIASGNSDDDMYSSESSTFTADNHVRHFKDIFTKNYRTSLSDWLIFQIADNTNANLKIIRLLSVSHTSCTSHKLNLEVESNYHI